MSKIITSDASIDLIYNGQARGRVASMLLANEMKVNTLRTNDTLRHEEWQAIDQTVVDICRQRMVGVQDLVSRGLTYNITNGLGTMVLAYEDMSDMSAAEITMDAATRKGNDRIVYDLKQLPLPITHKAFQISTRVLNASRRLGQPLDTTQAAIAARKVSEMIETILFTGGSNLTFGGGTIYGYLDYPNRNTVDLSTNWDDSPSDGESILDDVRAMKQASIDGKHYGPWVLYVPTNYETVLDEDYSSSKGTNTIRQRILDVAGISDVKVADYLTDDNVLLVEMIPETVRMIMGMQPTNVEWQTEGGMIFHFMVMAIMVPQIRADQDGNCGIVHLRAAT